MEQTCIGVTGAHGFLGWHTACHLSSMGAEVRRLGRDELAGTSGPGVDGLDAVCHLAGVNRGDDTAVHDGNIQAARQLIDRIRAAASPPRRIVYANSTQSGSASPYGTSKRQAGVELREFCESQGIEYFEALVPNVFGEGGRPFYNSFVATFCHQLVRGEPCTIVEDREVTLIHAQEVARILGEAATAGTAVPCPMPGTTTTVSAVLARLEAILASYTAATFPELEDPFDIDLFNTLRAAIFADRGPVIPFTKHADARGAFVEIVRAKGGGQTSVSTTVPGITRGNHYHLRKVERFAVVQGSAVIEMRRLFSDDVQSYHVTGDAPVAVEIPTLHTHLITNTGDDLLLTLFWTNEFFDPERPDTHVLAVDPASAADR